MLETWLALQALPESSDTGSCDTRSSGTTPPPPLQAAAPPGTVSLGQISQQQVKQYTLGVGVSRHEYLKGLR